LADERGGLQGVKESGFKPYKLFIELGLNP